MARTLLIGLDGAPVIERGVMPARGDLVAGGARAELRSVMPPLTPPAWTSLMTGKRPGQHGVFDFFQKESPDSDYYRLATSREVDSATIWSLASDSGRRVISLNFPLMFPPPPIDGAVVPGGWMPWRQLRLGCHPPGLFDRLKTLPSFNPREMALDLKLEAKAIEGCPEGEYGDWIELHTRREERWFEVVRFLLETEPADLIGVMFDGADKLQHLCWRFIAGDARTAWERDIAERCERYFRRLDAMIGALVELAGSDANVVIASDHGFGPSDDLFYVNSWLEKAGYLAWADADGMTAEAAPQVGFASMMRHITALDWDRTVAYAATPSSQGISIVHGLPRARYLELRDEIAAGLRAIRRPDGQPLVSEVWTREEAFSGPHEELGPDLSMMLADGAAFSILRSNEVVRRLDETRGNHRWQGIFIAAGPAMRRAVTVGELSIVDVAPLILYSLGLPVPSDMTGRVPTEVIDPAELECRPPRSAEPPGASPQPVTAATFDSDGEAALVERLRALGYVE